MARALVMNATIPEGSGLLEASPVGGFKIKGRILKSAHGRLAASPDRACFEQAAARADANRS
jgi:hypothetical protein